MAINLSNVNVSIQQFQAVASGEVNAGKELAKAVTASAPVVVSPRMLQSLVTGVLRPYEDGIKNGTALAALSTNNIEA